MDRKKTLCIALLVIVLMGLTGALTMRLAGVSINEPGWSVAKTAAAKHNVNICKRIFIMPWEIASPSTEEQRRGCIHDYASLTHDPSACELLMPSEYGWSCLGAATEKQPCLFDFAQEPEVRGNGIIALMKECLDGSADIQNNSCCIMARTVFLEENFDCALLKELPAFEDQCLRETALKRREPDTCASISNGNIRSSCEVGVRALLRK